MGEYEALGSDLEKSFRWPDGLSTFIRKNSLCVRMSECVFECVFECVSECVFECDSDCLSLSRVIKYAT